MTDTEVEPVSGELGHDPTRHSRVLGTSPRRKEDQRLVTGHGRFVGDLVLPGMRQVAFLRSPVAHARITAVHTEAAMEAGHRVFTGADFAAVALRAKSALPSYVETEQPVLAHTRARFAGEAVAAVVAADRYQAEDGCELVDRLRPSTLAEEYCNARSGAGPPNDAGTRNG